MGYDCKEIKIYCRVSRHNDERDKRDDKLVENLEDDIRDLIYRHNKGYHEVVTMVDRFGDS